MNESFVNEQNFSLTMLLFRKKRTIDERLGLLREMKNYRLFTERTNFPKDFKKNI